MAQNAGNPLRMKKSMRKLKSVKVTDFDDVFSPLNIQKNINGNPKQIKVGLLNIPITHIVESNAHLLYEC
jgi:hypothetical protein